MDAFIFFGCMLGVLWLIGWAWERKAKGEQEEWERKEQLGETHRET